MAFAAALRRIADGIQLLQCQLDRVVKVADSLERIANAQDEIATMMAFGDAFYDHQSTACPKLWQARGEMAKSILRERGIKLPVEDPAP